MLKQEQIGVIILAAGQASRMGQLKQLLEWRGKPLIAHVVDNILTAGFKQIIVVVGYRGEQIKQALADYCNLTVVENPNYAMGQSESLRVGIESLENLCFDTKVELKGGLIALADQPTIEPAIYKLLADKFLTAKENAEKTIVMPVFQGKRGNPVVFDKAYFKELKNVTGDRGGRVIFRRYEHNIVFLPVDTPEVLKDVDNQKDYQALGE